MEPTSAATPATVTRPSWRSVLLGLFVLFQIIYLPLANLTQLVPRETPQQRGELDIGVQREGTASRIRPVQQAIDGLGTAIDRYAEVSGQTQAWSLFAPDFAVQSIYLVTSFRCREGGRESLFTLEQDVPADPDRYFRWPRPDSRRIAYEFLLAAVYWRFSEESLQQRGAEWREAVLDRVRAQQRSLQSYLGWELRRFREAHPDQATPVEIALSVRILPSPKPRESGRVPALIMPLARWFPDRAAEPGFLPIEAFDPSVKEFVRLPVAEPAP
jgi:hypothetical protein